ncbi:MAG: DUF1285 domain-containing protein [Luminiphilus sp.]
MADDAFARLVRTAGSVSATNESPAMFAGSVNGRQPYPLDQWNPANCGYVDIAIDRDGRWFHEGSEIKRVELVALFAGLLRREEDGGYYLVTPVEKVEVSVALHPLMVVDATRIDNAPTGDDRLGLILNSGGVFYLDDETGLTPEPAAGGAAFISLPHNLTALFTRAAWYRLVDMADDDGCVESGGQKYSLL